MILLALIFSTFQFNTFEPVRTVRTGYGAIIDDLESHARPGHPMRNEKDLMNWTHELTHQVNSDLRQQHPGCNCFYVFNDRYLVGASAAILELAASLCG
jgi:hypothetical protein